MQQFFEAKAGYPDAILFFRMGDFYEMFFEDAVTAARVARADADLAAEGQRQRDPDGRRAAPRRRRLHRAS